MSGCGCIYVWADDCSAQFNRTTYPKAIKIHKCTECGRNIQPGETYEREEGLWESGFLTFKTCNDCLSLRKAFFCEGWIYKELWTDLKSHVVELEGNISSECLQKLTPRAREKVISIIDESIEEDLNEAT